MFIFNCHLIFFFFGRKEVAYKLKITSCFSPLFPQKKFAIFLCWELVLVVCIYIYWFSVYQSLLSVINTEPLTVVEKLLCWRMYYCLELSTFSSESGCQWQIFFWLWSQLSCQWSVLTFSKIKLILKTNIQPLMEKKVYMQEFALLKQKRKLLCIMLQCFWLFVAVDLQSQILTNWWMSAFI